MFSCLFILTCFIHCCMATSFRTKNRPQKAYQGWSDIDHIYVMLKAPCKGGIIPMEQWGKSWLFAHVGTVSWFQAIYIIKLLTINNKQPYLDFGLTSSPTSKTRYTWKMVCFFLLLDERSPCNMQLSTKLISQRTNPPWAPLFGLKRLSKKKTKKHHTFGSITWFPSRSHQQTFMNQTKNMKKDQLLSSLQKKSLVLLGWNSTLLHSIQSHLLGWLERWSSPSNRGIEFCWADAWWHLERECLYTLSSSSDKGSFWMLLKKRMKEGCCLIMGLLSYRLVKFCCGLLWTEDGTSSIIQHNYI